MNAVHKQFIEQDRHERLAQWRTLVALAHTGELVSHRTRRQPALAEAICADFMIRDAVFLDLVNGPAEAALSDATRSQVTAHVDALMSGLVVIDADAAKDRQEALNHLLITGPEYTNAAVHTLSAVLAWSVRDMGEATRHIATALFLDPHYRLAMLMALTIGRNLGPGDLNRT